MDEPDMRHAVWHAIFHHMDTWIANNDAEIDHRRPGIHTTRRIVSGINFLSDTVGFIPEIYRLASYHPEELGPDMRLAMCIHRRNTMMDHRWIALLSDFRATADMTHATWIACGHDGPLAMAMKKHASDILSDIWPRIDSHNLNIRHAYFAMIGSGYHGKHAQSVSPSDVISLWMDTYDNISSRAIHAAGISMREHQWHAICSWSRSHPDPAFRKDMATKLFHITDANDHLLEIADLLAHSDDPG
jgi:hypothetical protein